MNDLILIAIFVGCLLATFGLVRMCEWLRPGAEHDGDSRTGQTSPRGGGAAQ